MTLEQINALTVKDVLQIIISKIITLPEGEFVSYDESIEGAWYEKIVMPEGITKPSKDSFQSTFDNYISELTTECNRVKNLETTFHTLYSKDSGMPSFRKIWPEIANPLAFFNQNLHDKEFDFKFNQVLLEETKLEKSDLVQKAYDKMNSDVYTKMQEVFGTSNAESAAANQSTWSLMMQSPSAFVGSLGFTSEAEVIAYSQPKHESAIAYGIWRLTRIQQFRDERSQILGA